MRISGAWADVRWAVGDDVRNNVFIRLLCHVQHSSKPLYVHFVTKFHKQAADGS